MRRLTRCRARSWCRARAHPHRQPMGRVPGSMATMSGCCWTRHRASSGRSWARNTPSGTRRESAELCLCWVGCTGQGLGIPWPPLGCPCRYSRGRLNVLEYSGSCLSSVFLLVRNVWLDSVYLPMRLQWLLEVLHTFPSGCCAVLAPGV